MPSWPFTITGCSQTSLCSCEFRGGATCPTYNICIACVFVRGSNFQIHVWTTISRSLGIPFRYLFLCNPWTNQLPLRYSAWLYFYCAFFNEKHLPPVRIQSYWDTHYISQERSPVWGTRLVSCSGTMQPLCMPHETHNGPVTTICVILGGSHNPYLTIWKLRYVELSDISKRCFHLCPSWLTEM